MERLQQYNNIMNVNSKKKIPLFNLSDIDIINITGKEFYNDISSKNTS